MKKTLATISLFLLAGLAGCVSPAAKPVPTVPPAAVSPAVPAAPAALTPYLQNPTGTGMTVCFLAQEATQVRVAWGRDGAWFLTKTEATGTAIPGTPWTVWKVRLEGLKPGKAYEYQVRYRLAEAKKESPVYHFRALDPQAASLHAIAFNDLHNRDALLAKLMQQVKPEDYEYSLLLGDCLADPRRAGVFQTWDRYVQLLDGASKPIVFVRGNHETRGEFSRRLAYLFDLPNLDPSRPWGEEQWQFTWQAGPVYFLAMDGGEDDDTGTAVDSYKNPRLWQKVRANEAEWLKSLNAAQAGQEAPWRVFLCHIPLYNSPCVSARVRDAWSPALSDFRPDLMLAGHDHTWRKPNAPSAAAPWPTLVGGGPGDQGGEEGTVMFLSADASTLKVRLAGAKDGRTLAEFSSTKAK